MAIPIEAETLLAALRRVLDFSTASAGVKAAARRALDAYRPLAPAALPRCATCKEIPDECGSLSTSTNPNSLPPPCYRLIPEELVQRSRCWEEVRCESCGAAYIYHRSYEYLAGGSEDGETFTRLDVAPLLDRVANLLERRPHWSQEFQQTVDLLERAIRRTPP